MPFMPIYFILRYWKFFIPLGALFFLVAGVNGIYVGLANPRPKTLTVAQFEQDPPSSGWYHVTGGYLDMSQSTTLMGDGSRPGYGSHADYTYIALHSPNEAPGTPVHAFFRTSNPALMQEAEANAPEISRPDANGRQDIYAKPPVYRQLDFTGMVQSDHPDETILRRRLGETAEAVDSGAVVIADGVRPNIWKGLGMLAMGIILTIGCIQIWIGDDNPFLRGPVQEDLPDQPGLGSIPYSPGQSYPDNGGYAPPYGQASPPPQYPPPYGQAPPAPQSAPPYHPPVAPSYAQPSAPPPAPVKPGKTDSIPPPFDPFADQR
jgi:hypothetical protein